jgi:IS66 C-terminal element
MAMAGKPGEQFWAVVYLTELDEAARTEALRPSVSLIASAKLNDVEPFTYLRDILQRMTEGHPMSRLDDLLPWNWPKMRVKH